MSLEKETEKIIQDLQILEQNMHNLLLQKQAFQIELNETLNASEEVKKTKDEVYKVTGNIMIRADKEVVLKELEEKGKIFKLRITTIEKQERLLESKIKELQDEAKKILKPKKS